MLNEKTIDNVFIEKLSAENNNYHSNLSVFSFKDAKPSSGNCEFYFKKLINSNKIIFLSTISYLEFNDIMNLKMINKTSYRILNKNLLKDYLGKTSLTNNSRKKFWLNNLTFNSILESTKRQLEINYEINSKDLFYLILNKANEKEIENPEFKLILGEISRDLNRTFHTGIFLTEEGISKLRNVLNAIAYIRPEVNYCQGMNFVAGGLLSNFGEDFSFWIFLVFLDEYELNSLYSKVNKK
jgi:hypothetical protein